MRLGIEDNDLALACPVECEAFVRDAERLMKMANRLSGRNVTTLNYLNSFVTQKLACNLP